MNQVSNNIPQLSKNLQSSKIKKKSIIYIDDRPLNRERIKEKINEAGYEITIIQEILEAIPLLSLPTINPDLIFLNMDMAVVSGYEILAKIQKIDRLREISIIAIVKNKRIGNLLKAKTLQISDFIVQPIIAEKISDTVTNFFFLNFNSQIKSSRIAEPQLQTTVQDSKIMIPVPKNPETFPTFETVKFNVEAEKTKKIIPLSGSNNSEKLPQSSKNSLISETFIANCQQELAASIGPIASFICQSILINNPEINEREFIKALALEIPDENEASKFQQRVVNYILPSISND